MKKANTKPVTAINGSRVLIKYITTASNKAERIRKLNNNQTAGVFELKAARIPIARPTKNKVLTASPTAKPVPKENSSRLIILILIFSDPSPGNNNTDNQAAQH